MALPFPLNLNLSGDGPVSQRIDAKKTGDRNFVFQVGSGLSADTGGNSGAGTAGSSLPSSLAANLGPWVLGIAAALALLLLWPSRRS